jgi:hypothetical protein
MNDVGAVSPDPVRAASAEGDAVAEADGAAVEALPASAPQAANDTVITATTALEMRTRPTLIIECESEDRMRSRTGPGLTGVGLIVLAFAATAACAGSSAAESAPVRTTSSTTTTTPPALTPSPKQVSLHAAAPTGRPRFAWSTKRVTKASLGKSWHEGCPIGPRKLRALTLTFWGFDRTAHKGVLISRKRAVPAYVSAFHEMYRQKFPVRKIKPVSEFDGSDNKSMRHDNTSAFNCRYAVSDGPKHWSMHAYGEAIDINPRENPYYLNGRVYPPQGEPYLDRSNVRRGMIVPGSTPVKAFSAVGWGWGGNWSSSPDYQHFSSTGG